MRVRERHEQAIQAHENLSVLQKTEIGRLQKKLDRLTTKSKRQPAEPGPHPQVGRQFTAEAEAPSHHADEEVVFSGLGDNTIAAMTPEERFSTGREMLGNTLHTDRRTSSFGLNFGRIAASQRQHFIDVVKPENKKSGVKQTMRDYLTGGFGCDISTINAWVTAVGFVDSTETPWCDVEAWCQETNWNRRTYGAERVRAMARDYFRRND